MNDDFHDRLDELEDAVADESPNDDEESPADEMIARLETLFAGSRGEVREIAAEHGVPTEDLLEEYEHRENPYE